MTLKLSHNASVGVSIVAVVAVAISCSYTDHQSAFAITRGTPYDDLLSSAMTADSKRRDIDLMGTDSAQAGSQADPSSVFIYGDLGNDEIKGSNQSDHLAGGPGSDVVYGYNSGDYIQGDLGIDSLYGGPGDDVLSGGQGADYFDCGDGKDSIDDFDPMEGDFAVANCEILENEEKPVAVP